MINRKDIIESSIKLTGVMMLLQNLIIKIKQKNPNHPMLKDVEGMFKDLLSVSSSLLLFEEYHDASSECFTQNKNLGSDNFRLRNEVDRLTKENEELKKVNENLQEGL